MRGLRSSARLSKNKLKSFDMVSSRSRGKLCESCRAFETCSSLDEVCAKLGCRNSNHVGTKMPSPCNT